MTQKQTKRISIDNVGAVYDIDMGFDRFISWLTTMVHDANIPAEHRAGLRITMQPRGGGDFDPNEIELDIFYDREETDAEAEARVAVETERLRRQAEFRRQEEVSTLYQLLKKYPELK